MPARTRLDTSWQIIMKPPSPATTNGRLPDPRATPIAQQSEQIAEHVERGALAEDQHAFVEQLLAREEAGQGAIEAVVGEAVAFGLLLGFVRVAGGRTGAAAREGRVGLEAGEQPVEE